MALAERFGMPVFSDISSRFRSSPFMRMSLCSEGGSRLMAFSIDIHCSCCRRGMSAVRCPTGSGMLSNRSVSRNFCRRHTLTHRFLVARMSRASRSSSSCQPRRSIRSYTSCTMSSAFSSSWKKSVATRSILERVFRSVRSNSIRVIYLYNARHHEMLSRNYSATMNNPL